MRGCKGQVAAANLSLPEERMLPKLLSLWRGRRATRLCQRNGWEKSGRKKITSEKAIKRVGSRPGSLRQMALLVTTAAAENPGDNRGSWQIFKDCYQLLSPNHLSFAEERKLFTGTSLSSLHPWQRWYLDIARRIKLLNASNVLSCSKILKPNGFAAFWCCAFLLQLALQPAGLLTDAWTEWLRLLG